MKSNSAQHATLNNVQCLGQPKRRWEQACHFFPHCGVWNSFAPDLAQALQKLQTITAKVEATSSEALKATEAESTRAAQAEAARCAQTDAIANSLLAFKQTHAAELAKRDAAIAELQRAVGRLQGSFEGQQNPNDGHSQTAEGQQEGGQRQQQAASVQHLRSIGQGDITEDSGHIVVGHKAAGGPTKGSLEQKAAKGSLKGRARQSIDGNVGRKGPRTATTIPSRASSSLSRGGPSTPQGGLSTQTDQQQRRPLTELSENEVFSYLPSASRQPAISPSWHFRVAGSIR